VREAFEWLGAVTCYKKAQVDDNYAPVSEEKNKKVVINGKEIVKKAPRKKKNPISGDAIKTSPINQLGFGIVAYVNILWTLIWTFALYTIFLLPVMMFFSEGTAYSDVLVKSSYLDGYLGNMGYSSVQCASIPTNVDRLSLACPYGTIGEFLDYGINPLIDNKNTCVNNDSNSMCKPDADFVMESLLSSVGDPDHLFTFENKSLFKDNTGKAACDTMQSTLFVQFTCTQEAASQELKYNQVALAVTIGVLICILFTVSIRAMYQGGKITQIEWDVTTVTAGDFSVEFTIQGAKYEAWKQDVYRAPNGYFENNHAPAAALKQHLKKEIETNLDKWVDHNSWAAEELYGKAKNTTTSAVARKYGGTKVADIVFSFNNSRLISALRARGGTIAAQDFDAMRAEE